MTQGGATHSFLEMVTALKSLGVCPIVCTSEHDYINVYLDEQGIRNISIGHKTVLRPMSSNWLKKPLRLIKHGLIFYYSEWQALRKLKKNIDFSLVDLVHTNSARNDIGCFINKKYGIPHIMHIREFADADFDCISLRKDYINLFNKYTTKFISISNAVKKHWVYKGIINEKVITIYNGIHFEDISISSDDDKKSSFKMVFVGGIVPTKGQKLSVEAISYLPQEVRDNISLDIIGWGIEEYIKEIKNIIADTDYANKVHLLGSLDDVHLRLGNYQIGLMCSKAEGFGRVTAEYMHAQLGVIASNSGANPEIVEDGVNGLLYSPGDARSLAMCILKLYRNRELLINLSRAAYRKARKVYTQQENAKKILDIYEKVISKAR